MPSKKAAKAPKSDASSSASDVESDSSDASVVDLDPPLPLDLMPRERGSGAEFNSLIAAICRRPWLALSKIESAASWARCGVKQRSALRSPSRRLGLRVPRKGLRSPSLALRATSLHALYHLGWRRARGLVGPP